MIPVLNYIFMQFDEVMFFCFLFSEDSSKTTSTDEQKKEQKKPLHSIEEIVKGKDTNRTSSPNSSSHELGGSAFHIHTPRPFPGLNFWKQQQLLIPNLYSFPMTSSPYDHVTSRQLSSALALRCQGDSRFCSS